jgi:hypothetical protein
MPFCLNEHQQILLTKEFLYREYIVNKKSQKTIADEFGFYRGTVSKYLKKYGITIRSPKQFSKFQNISGSNNPNYKQGKCIQNPKCIDCGKELKNFYAKRCHSCDSSGKRNYYYGKLPSHGKRFKYKGYIFRSSWEFKLAQYLDAQNIIWFYEVKTFTLSNGTTYTPDFYLLRENTWLEVKGYWRDNARQKFELFKEEYPDIVIEVITRNILQKWGVLK